MAPRRARPAQLARCSAHLADAPQRDQETRTMTTDMKHRHLGTSGLLVSEIAYGNWLTHGSQVEKDAAFACVRAALDEGITTFDTADVYASTRAEA